MTTKNGSHRRRCPGHMLGAVPRRAPPPHYRGSLVKVALQRADSAVALF